MWESTFRSQCSIVLSQTWLITQQREFYWLGELHNHNLHLNPWVFRTPSLTATLFVHWRTKVSWLILRRLMRWGKWNLSNNSKIHWWFLGKSDLFLFLWLWLCFIFHISIHHIRPTNLFNRLSNIWQISICMFSQIIYLKNNKNQLDVYELSFHTFLNFDCSSNLKFWYEFISRYEINYWEINTNYSYLSYLPCRISNKHPLVKNKQR